MSEVSTKPWLLWEGDFKKRKMRAVIRSNVHGQYVYIEKPDTDALDHPIWVECNDEVSEKELLLHIALELYAKVPK